MRPGWRMIRKDQSASPAVFDDGADDHVARAGMASPMKCRENETFNFDPLLGWLFVLRRRPALLDGRRRILAVH